MSGTGAPSTPCSDGNKRLRCLDRCEERSITDTVLMVRPCQFGFNDQTAESNKFQTEIAGDCQPKALAEFNAYVELLRSEGIQVVVVDDTKAPPTPDSIFPNNWFSTEAKDDTVCLFPMFTPNRRDERNKNVLSTIRDEFIVRRIVDLSPSEHHGEILEGTGSLVLDKTNRIVYAALGPRTCLAAVRRFAHSLGYSGVVTFSAQDSDKVPIYHTNVLMTIGEEFAIVCFDVITEGRDLVKKSLLETKKTLIHISQDQMKNYAGNCLQLRRRNQANTVVIMSARAEEVLTEDQRALIISSGGPIITAHIPTIETVGGGSARCMLAEVFLQAKA